jgi:hypothetical protein
MVCLERGSASIVASRSHSPDPRRVCAPLGFRQSTNPGCERESMATSDENDVPGTLPARLRQAWPLAAMAIAVLVNVLWIGALGYALITLL